MLSRLIYVLVIALGQGFSIAAHAAQIDRLAAFHFLEQAAFGPTPAEVAGVQQAGFENWLNEQFDLPETPIEDTKGQLEAMYANLGFMTEARDQLRQCAIYSLYRILIIIKNKNGAPLEIEPHMRLHSKHAFGNYQNLLHDVARSGAMGKYLDLVGSCAQTGTEPNKNFARELLQLLSIGPVEPDKLPELECRIPIAMEESDILFQTLTLRDAQSRKAFEYLPTGKPLLAMTAPSGELDNLVSETKAGWTADPDDRDSIRKAMLEIVECMDGCAPVTKADPASVAAYKRPALVRKAAELPDIGDRGE